MVGAGINHCAPQGRAYTTAVVKQYLWCTPWGESAFYHRPITHADRLYAVQEEWKTFSFRTAALQSISNAPKQKNHCALKKQKVGKYVALVHMLEDIDFLCMCELMQNTFEEKTQALL